MERIQRVPRGLNELLSLAGGVTPQNLAEHVQATLDLLQFYGLQQRQALTATGTVAEGSFVTVTPNAGAWTIVFLATASFTKTATQTALRGSIILNWNPGTQNMPIASDELGPFGATETGAAHVCYTPPYPMLLAPGGTLSGTPNILGTDATVATVMRVEFGVLG